MEYLGPTLTATGIVGLFTAAAVLVLNLLRENGRMRAERAAEIVALKADIAALKTENTGFRSENFACRLQVNGLCSVLRDNGIPIPDWLFRSSEVPGAE